MKIRVRDRAAFQPDRMARVGLSTTDRTQLDLYCLEPGQAQKPHTHEGQDKIYLVLEGRGRFTLGAAEEAVEAGEAVVAPAGTSHGVANDSGARLLVLVVVSPRRRTWADDSARGAAVTRPGDDASGAHDRG